MNTEDDNKPGALLGLLKSHTAGASAMLAGMRERLTGYQRDLSPPGVPPDEPSQQPEQEPDQKQPASEPASDVLQGLQRVTPDDLSTPTPAQKHRTRGTARQQRIDEIARRRARERMADMLERQEQLREIFRPTPIARAVRGVIAQWRRESEAGRKLARQFRESQKKHEPTAGTQPAAARMADVASSHEDESTAAPATEV